MNLASLVLIGLRRKPVRTALTMLSIAVAFLLFGTLNGANAVLNEVSARARPDVMVTGNRTRGRLPLAYRMRIEEFPGIQATTQVSWLPGFYQDPKNSLGVMAVDPPAMLRANPDFIVSNEHRAAMLTARNGMLVGSRLMQRHGWSIGDVIPLTTPIPRMDGSRIWELQIVGTYDNAREPSLTEGALMHYAYLDESRAQGKGTVDMYLSLAADPDSVTALADALDKEFANSSGETATQPTRDLAASFNRQLGDVGFFVNTIASAALFTLLLLTCNIMMQSVRERTRQIGVLRALGFSHSAIAALIFLEALVLCSVGASIGLVAATFLFPLLHHVAGPIFGPLLIGVQRPPAGVIILCIAAAALLALLSGLLPAMRALRLPVTEALAAH